MRFLSSLSQVILHSTQTHSIPKMNRKKNEYRGKPLTFSTETSRFKLQGNAIFGDCHPRLLFLNFVLPRHILEALCALLLIMAFRQNPCHQPKLRNKIPLVKQSHFFYRFRLQMYDILKYMAGAKKGLCYDEYTFQNGKKVIHCCYSNLRPMNIRLYWHNYASKCFCIQCASYRSDSILCCGWPHHIDNKTQH